MSGGAEPFHNAGTPRASTIHTRAPLDNSTIVHVRAVNGITAASGVWSLSVSSHLPQRWSSIRCRCAATCIVLKCAASLASNQSRVRGLCDPVHARPDDRYNDLPSGGCMCVDMLITTGNVIGRMVHATTDPASAIWAR